MDRGSGGQGDPGEISAISVKYNGERDLPEDVFGRAATWVAPGGHLVVVGHALRNLTDGVGGPQDPAILNTPEQLREKARGLEILRCEEVERTTADGATAIDVVLVARRPG